MSKIKSLADIASVFRYLNRIGAEPRSLRTAIVKELAGRYWRDVAVINIAPDGMVKAPEEYQPTETEAAAIKAECHNIQWPELKPQKSVINAPKQWSGIDPETLFYFLDLEGNIVMVQQRINDRAGGKAYVPWTYWDDDEWRCMEPEGKLPLWGADQLKDHTTAFIHEGAKAARHVRRMVEGRTPADVEALKAHPWGEELSHAAHIGWIGGALSPARTDWGLLKKMGIKRAYIVSDNDEPGVAAVPSISYQLRLPTFHLQFTSEWPVAFDLADPFPTKMFRRNGGATYYTGPSFRSCLHPATWATDQVPNPKGKPTTVLREEFKNMWTYVEEADLFVCKEMPEILRPEAIVNKMLSAFSHSNNTAALMVRSYRGRNTKLCYRPDIVGRVVTDKTTSAVNLHTPTHIKSIPGDVTPWIDFLAYLFPIESERSEVMRWVATLIARPDVKMHYGMLLVSETQGIGKTTLGANILAPLVGDHNCGFPSESDIVDSPFNSWVANKRLIIIGEIYSGHSWKAYNRLKSYITDKDIECNQKYQKAYRVENWAHLLASSNSRKALKMEETDRRWFYPSVTEVKWPEERFRAFHEWVASGALQIIHHWAKQYGSYVAVGEQAPMTQSKKEMIAASKSDAYHYCREAAVVLCSTGASISLSTSDVLHWATYHTHGPLHETPDSLGKALAEGGLVSLQQSLIERNAKQDRYQVKIDGSYRYMFMTPALATDCAERLAAVSNAATDAEWTVAKGQLFEIIRRANKSWIRSRGDFPLAWPL
ncbi:primase-helicase family protein [Rhizobium sp.]